MLPRALPQCLTHRARSDNNLMVQTWPCSSQFAPVSHQTAFVLVAKSKCGLPPANAAGEKNEVAWQRAAGPNGWGPGKTARTTSHCVREKSLQGRSFSLQEGCGLWMRPFGPWGMAVRFERKEGRSYNNLSFHPPVFEWGTPGPCGRGILIGMSKRLSWLPDIEWGSGYWYSCWLMALQAPALTAESLNYWKKPI